MARPEPLTVWLYGVPVATLAAKGPGRIECRYTSDALDGWPLNTPLLSCSLPLQTRPHRDAGPFFRGLLPEGAALASMAAAARVPSFDTLGILARFGRDVAGAAVIASEPGEPRDGSVEPYDHHSLAQEVAGLDERPLALHDDSELSLPGLQNKLLLVRTPDGWGRPVAGLPSTHILKVEDRRFPGLVTEEVAALSLARAVGLTSVSAEVVTFDGVDCLIVDRFDRQRADEPESEAGPLVPLRRLHQEDVCQALGIDAEAAAGQAKYEFAGGPGLASVAGLLDRFSEDPVDQLDRLLAVAAFTVAIGNADAHGKNLALLHARPGAVELAPLYDTVPTALFPSLRAEAAMRVNGRAELARITGADLVAEAVGWRMPAGRASDVVASVLDRLEAAAQSADCTPGLARLVRDRCHHLKATL